MTKTVGAVRQAGDSPVRCREQVETNRALLLALERCNTAEARMPILDFKFPNELLLIIFLIE
jgi:hypothetical protein